MSDSVPPRQKPDDPWRTEGTPPPHPSTPPRRLLPAWGWLILAALAVFLVTDLVLSLTGGNTPRISYTEFDRQLDANNISKLYSKGDAIEGQLKKEQTAPDGDGGGKYTKFKTQRPVFADDDLWATLARNKVTVTAAPVVQQRSFLYNLLISLAPVLLLVALWIFIEAGAWAAP